MDRFDLENAMTETWQTSDEIKLLCDHIINKDLEKEEIVNVLMGIYKLHEMRCEKAFDIFENLIYEGNI